MAHFDEKDTEQNLLLRTLSQPLGINQRLACRGHETLREGQEKSVSFSGDRSHSRPAARFPEAKRN